MKITVETTVSTPAAEVVQQQLEAYNARDLDAWVATYHEDAEQYLLHAGPLAIGRDAIRQRMVERFKAPVLHAELVSRTVMGNIVVDHEFVTRSAAGGFESVQMVCIYEVTDGKIAKATFAMGQVRPTV